jgi:TrmH family RNA methyltransferase
MNTPIIILVDTLYGGNLGSVIRVMANFGLSRLRLVRPAKGILEDPLLKPMAREQALFILENIEIFDTLEEALFDTVIALGFSTRLGKRRTSSLSLREAVVELPKSSFGSVAAVFGSEDKGLNNQDLERCQLLTRIPTAPALTSLNLSQAVGLFAYETYLLRQEDELNQVAATPNKTANINELEGLYGHTENILRLIGFIKESNPTRIMNVMRTMVSRRLPASRDVRVLRGILSRVELAVERAKKGLL